MATLKTWDANLNSYMRTRQIFPTRQNQSERNWSGYIKQSWYWGNDDYYTLNIGYVSFADVQNINVLKGANIKEITFSLQTGGSGLGEVSKTLYIYDYIEKPETATQAELEEKKLIEYTGPLDQNTSYNIIFSEDQNSTLFPSLKDFFSNTVSPRGMTFYVSKDDDPRGAGGSGQGYGHSYLNIVNFSITIKYEDGISLITLNDDNNSEITIYSNRITNKNDETIQNITFNTTAIEDTNQTIYFLKSNGDRKIITSDWNVTGDKNILLQKFLNTKEAILEIKCDTSRDGTVLGTATVPITVKISNDYQVGIEGSITIEEKNTTIFSLTRSSLYIQSNSIIGFSFRTTTIDANIQSLSSCKVFLNEIESSATIVEPDNENYYQCSANLNLSNDLYKNIYGNNISYRVELTDSRGFVTERQGSIKIIQYNKPIITSLTSTACDQNGNPTLTGTYAQVRINGQFSSITYQNNGQNEEKNSVTIVITDTGTATPSFSFNQTSATDTIFYTTVISTDSVSSTTGTHVFSATITDELGNSSTVATSLGQKINVVDFVGNNDGEAGMAIGTTATTNDIGYVRLGWPLKFKDETVRQETVEALKISQSQATLPFQIAFGQTTVTGTGWTDVDLSSFLNQQGAAPIIVVSYASNADYTNITPLKTKDETAAGFSVCMCGDSGGITVRPVNWIAIQSSSSS